MEIHHLKKSFILFLALLALPAHLLAVTDAYVVKVDGSSVYLDWGTAAGVSAGDQFDVYRDGEELKHPVTGASLGKAQHMLGQGVVDGLQEKFCTGKMIETKEAVKVGDRAKHKAAAPAPVQAAPAGAATGAVAVAVPRETWRSDAIKQEATGIAAGDLDGDGKKELVVSYRDQIEVFRWNGTKLDSIAVFNHRSARNFLAVDTADLDKLGHDRIYASLFIENNMRARTMVFELRGNKLEEVGRVEGFVRTLTRMDGKRELVWQDLSMARELRVRQPSLLVRKDGKYADGDVLKLPRVMNEDQLFGYVWGDWDGDGAEDFAFLQNGEKLRVLFKDGKWSSKEVFGGSKLVYNWENEQYGTVFPRMQTITSLQGKPQLLVPHNVQVVPIRMSRLRIFKESELFAFGWNGLEMSQVWKLEIAGSLSDFVVTDITGQNQIWVAAVGTGDKTILLSYKLP